ncbi:MAG: PIN domain-containing protein [Hyphomicrobiaceae bacterium]|nr:PIN domain-containing protein [Hyphomicrobiaceae bacterium]
MIGGVDLFLDSNVLLYAAGGRAQAPEKHERALQILQMEFGLSAQVLAEFYVNAIRKGPKPLSPEVAKQWVVNLAKKPCLPIDANIVRSGIELSQRYQISYWDGAIIAAAERFGAKTLYTEDLSDGQVYGSVKVVNPFL